MLAANIDTVVLGCTHYPFVIPLIQAIVGDRVRVIDPAPAVARQTHRLLKQRNLLKDSVTTGQLQFATSGEPAFLKTFLERIGFPAVVVNRVRWDGLHLVDET